MIGIHIYNKQIKNYADEHTNITWEFGDYKFTISYHSFYDKQVYFENQKYLVLVDGWVFNSKKYETQAENILNLYLEKKDDIIYHLNGQFNILILEKEVFSFTYYNDIYSFRKHFYSIFDGHMLVSSDIKFLSNNISDLSLNIKHIKNNIENPRIINKNETFYSIINQVSPSTILKSDFNVFNYSLTKVLSKYKQSVSNLGNIDSILEKIRTRIKSVHKTDNVLLLLSGGLDSRFLLELFNYININVSTASYGKKGSDELNIAEEVAMKNKVFHYSCYLDADDFIFDAEKYIEQVGGLDIFVQSTIYKFYKKVKNFFNMDDFIIDTGFALDMFLGGSQLNVDVGHDYSIFNRVFSALAIRQSSHREFFEDRYCMYDYEIFALMQSLPLESIRNNLFYYKLCEKQIINTFNVKLQSTMFDLTLNPKYWKVVENIQYEKERFTLEYFKETGEAIYHNRYYSDFDMWLRDKDSWIKLINKLFLKRKSLLSKYFIPNEKVHLIINEHLNAEKTHLRDIVKWISLEFFLIKNKDSLNLKENNEK